MKKSVVVILLIVMCTLFVSNVSMGHKYFRSREMHPIRILAYVLHPVGIALEYGIGRPLHWLVSTKHGKIIFGHKPTGEETFFEWK